MDGIVDGNGRGRTPRMSSWKFLRSFDSQRRGVSRGLAWLAACMLAAAASVAPVIADTPGPAYEIRSSNDLGLFLEAIRVPGARITIAGNVNLDLSGRQDLWIAPGVHIIGDQSTYPTGPRLFYTNPHIDTPAPPSYLFLVGDEWEGQSDNVRISGIRFDGGAGPEYSNKVAIAIRSSINVEIDHCEFYRWGRTAIEVGDPHEDLWGDRMNLANATTIHVHDNYIHDNQYVHDNHELDTVGYGVVTGKAYALIEQNVFYNNRHSIAGDGMPGSGYLVYRNLELANDGPNSDEQQIDMHGRNDCGGAHANCGPAGEYMDIRYNTVQHTGGRSFLLRGVPSYRADVAYNVFALPQNAALKQNEGNNMKVWGNAFELNTYDDEKYCDFDGDGIVDRFMATGITWWYRSSLVGHRWTYLNQSTKRAGSLTFGDVTGDGRCDITIPGVIFKSGMAPTRSTDVLWRKSDGTSPLMWQLATDGNVYGTRNPGSALAANDQILGAGDFDGDGDSDIITRSPDGRVHRVIMDDGGAFPKEAQVTWVGPVLAGVGDFDGDGADDVLWRRSEGRLEIWFSGMSIRAAAPTRDNQGSPLEDAWQIKGVGRFNHDDYADILLRHADGRVAIWLMNGGTWTGELTPFGTDYSGLWDIHGVGDFDADDRADILWRSTLGQLAISYAGLPPSVYPTYLNQPGRLVESFWKIKGVADMNADGRSDIFWHNTNTGWVRVWTMNGSTWTGEANPGHDAGGTWKVEGLLPLRNNDTQPPPGSNAVLIPDLTGYSRIEANQALFALGLVPGAVSERLDCDNENRVSDQSPNGGIRVAPGTSVRLWFGIRPAPPFSCL